MSYFKNHKLLVVLVILVITVIITISILYSKSENVSIISTPEGTVVVTEESFPEDIVDSNTTESDKIPYVDWNTYLENHGYSTATITETELVSERKEFPKQAIVYEIQQLVDNEEYYVTERISQVSQSMYSSGWPIGALEALDIKAKENDWYLLPDYAPYYEIDYYWGSVCTAFVNDVPMLFVYKDSTVYVLDPNLF